jgi:hypothetical protein
MRLKPAVRTVVTRFRNVCRAEVLAARMLSPASSQLPPCFAQAFLRDAANARIRLCVSLQPQC